MASITVGEVAVRMETGAFVEEVEASVVAAFDHYSKERVVVEKAGASATAVAIIGTS